MLRSRYSLAATPPPARSWRRCTHATVIMQEMRRPVKERLRTVKDARVSSAGRVPAHKREDPEVLREVGAKIREALAEAQS